MRALIKDRMDSAIVKERYQPVENVLIVSGPVAFPAIFVSPVCNLGGGTLIIA
jgi:hypothetical protein